MRTTNPNSNALPDDLERMAEDSIQRLLADESILEKYQASRVEWDRMWTGERHEEWLCEPLLPESRLVSVYSPAKAGKSLLALSVSAALATGRPVLDQAAGEPVDVLYLDLEMSEDDLRERLEDMGYGPEADLSHLHYHLLSSLPPLDRPEGGHELVTLARLYGARLVVIDTLSRTFEGRENDADTFIALNRHTLRPLKSAGRTVWRLDHSGKDLKRGQRGSSAKNDDADVIWELQARDHGAYRLRATHSRVGWVPSQVDLLRLDDPLRFQRGWESLPEGADDLVRKLDEMGVPLDEGRPAVRKRLTEADIKAKTGVLAAAIEAAHAVVAIALGLSVARIIAHRHYARSDEEHGSVEWVPGTPLQDAAVWLAATVLDLEGTEDDERRAAEAMPLGLDRARALAAGILWRRDGEKALRELAYALRAAPGMTMSGLDAAEVVREHIR